MSTTSSSRLRAPRLQPLPCTRDGSRSRRESATRAASPKTNDGFSRPSASSTSSRRAARFVRRNRCWRCVSSPMRVVIRRGGRSRAASEAREQRACHISRVCGRVPHLAGDGLRSPRRARACKKARRAHATRGAPPEHSTARVGCRRPTQPADRDTAGFRTSIHRPSCRSRSRTVGTPSRSADGLVLLSLEPDDWQPELDPESTFETPVILGISPSVATLNSVAREHAAHALALESAIERADWVAERELRERLAGTAIELDQSMHSAFSPAEAQTRWLRLPEGSPLGGRHSLSAILSDLCDEVYNECPPIHNEMLARAALSSQGAKARYELLGAMTDAATEPSLGLEGYGPERAMYEAALRQPGIHRVRSATLGFGSPRRGTGYTAVWGAINRLLDRSASEPLTIEQLNAHLAAAPIGLKDGPIPVLVLAALLARADEVGLYEDGTFVGYLGPDVVDRLARNPDRFSVRNYALRGPRANVVAGLAGLLQVEPRERHDQRVSTVIGVVSPVLRAVRKLPPYSLRTRSLSATAIEVRSALLSAREPDQLLFVALPAALGLEPISSDTETQPDVVEAYAVALQAAVRELEDAYSALLDTVEASLAQHFGAPPDSVRDDLRVRAERLSDQVIDPGLRAIANALASRDAGREAWLEQLGMVIARTAPSSWTDDDRASALQALTHHGPAFRRVESLHFTQTQIAGGPFDAVRVAVTLPDGTDHATVVWADQHAQDELAALVNEALALSTARLGKQGAGNASRGARTDPGDQGEDATHAEQRSR